MMNASTEQLRLSSEPAGMTTVRPTWSQRVYRLIERFTEPYADLPPHLFATEEYLLLTGSVRRPGPHGLSPFD